MTPVFENDHEIDLGTIVNSISEAAFIVDPACEADNVATNFGHQRDLGINDSHWQSCVMNQDYVSSFVEYVEKGPADDSWTHHVIWKRPDNGEILQGFTSASWTADGLIVGRVTVFDKEPWWRKYFYLLASLFLGGGGFVLGWFLQEAI